MIQAINLSIGYSKDKPILTDLNFDFKENRIYGILAESGVGKTTFLKTISGLLKPLSGSVVIDGVKYRNTEKNPIYMMHQKYSNFGWLDCVDNILIAQRKRKLRKEEDALKVLTEVGLEKYADKWPSELSGGMQQRLALARVLYIKPKYLMMDEPLSALDEKTRSVMQQLILKYHHESGNTIVMVTHSREEANIMCDEIIEFKRKEQ